MLIAIRKISLFLTVSFVLINADAQKINIPAIECLGNVTSFSYTPPSGLTLSSATWTFGDGNNSLSKTPLYSYAGTGFYTVKIAAVFTNSTTRNDSIKIEVVGLPKAAFITTKNSDTCFNTNNLCYKDTSHTAKAGQTITSRLIVWGDGSFDLSGSPAFGDVVCHNYLVADIYKIRMEVTDKYGCKSIENKTVSIVENTEALFFDTVQYIDCKTVKVCYKNLSYLGNPMSATYKWLLDSVAVDTNKYF
ncbi:MAG: PKD domain-containing protein, partial [Bacteroidia bacterium]|nr:PKD domain-containing protein [Bacteroidia bacterium]